MSTTEKDYKKIYQDINEIGSIDFEEYEKAQKERDAEAEKKKKEEDLKKADILLAEKDNKIQKEKIENAKEKGKEIGEKIGENIEQHLDKKEGPQKPEAAEQNKNIDPKQPEVVDINKIDNPGQPEVVDINKEVLPDYHPEYKFQFDKDAQMKQIWRSEERDPAYASYYDEATNVQDRLNDIEKSMNIAGDIIKDEQERHPEFFANPMMAQERCNIISAVVMHQNGLLPKGSAAEMMAKEHPAVGLSGIEKTLTDLHKNPETGKMDVRVEDLFGNGFVLDDKGQMIQGGKRPWEKLDYANKMIAQGKTVYAMSRTNKVVEMNMGEPEAKPEGITPPKMDVKNNLAPEKLGKLVNHKVKKETIAQLTEIEKILDGTGVTKGDSDQFKNYKDCVKRTKENLEGTVFKADFDKQLDMLLNAGNEYYFAKAGQSKNATRMARCDTCNKLKELVKAAQKDKVPSKEIYNTQDSIRRDIASKAVKAFAMANKSSKDPTKQAMANDILSDTETFDKEVDRALNDQAFVATFGAKGSKAVSEAQLRKVSQQKGKDICKAVAGKRKELHEAGLEQTKQATSRQTKHARGTKWQEVSVPVKKGAAEQVADIKEKIEKMTRAYAGNPAFDELKHQVEVADIRLQGGVKQNVHYPRMMAKIADAADKFAKSTLPTKSGKKAEQIFDLTEQTRDLYDNVSNNKVPGLQHISPLEKSQRMLAEKIALNTAEKLQKSDIRANKEFGEQMLANRNIFEAATKEIMESKAFQSMMSVKGDPDKTAKNIADLLEKDPKDLEKLFNKEILKNKGRENPNAVKSFERLKTSEQKQIKKDELEKVKTSDQSIAFTR